MGKVWKYSIHQLGSKSEISVFSTLLTAIILILYSTELSLPLLTPLQVFAENSQGISARNTNLQSIRNNGSEIIVTNNSAANTNTTNIKAAAANSSGTVIEKISDKAIYKVQLRSNGPFNFLPKNGFDMQILFLNANASEPFANSIIKEQQQQQPIPVNSFDITIYSNNGKVLWQKTNQTITAATAFEKVAFTNGGGYNGGGGITIQIANIKPSSIPLGTAMPLFSQNSSNSSSSILGSTGNNNNNKTSTDSVTFTAAVAK
jgi:hypothetical protein